MSNVTLLILCAGSSSRFESTCKKQWLRINNEPLWLHVANRLSSFYNFEKIIITSSQDELNYMKNFSCDYEFVLGGDTRQRSMSNALKLVDSKYVMVTDVARSCVPKDVILELINNKSKASCIVPTLNVSDTVIYNHDTINRDDVKLIQTPQLSLTNILKKSLDTTIEFTDDSSAIKNINESVYYINGSHDSHKLTFIEDIKKLKSLQPPSKNFFTGFGIDTHPFEDGKEMFLGGIKIDSNFGFKAHSDGDVLIHSIIDALLGAIGAGDIGEFFPDTSEVYKNIDSKILLQKIVNFVLSVGYEIVNVDFTIVAQKPKINPYKMDIKKSIANILQIPMQFVNVKATTSEKLGFIGRSEGVTVHSVATLKYYDWKNI